MEMQPENKNRLSLENEPEEKRGIHSGSKKAEHS